MSDKQSLETVKETNDIITHSQTKRSDIEYIEEKFKIKNTVSLLHNMMSEITKDEINAKNVNSACYCIAQLNETINTTINAARFLREK